MTTRPCALTARTVLLLAFLVPGVSACSGDGDPEGTPSPPGASTSAEPSSPSSPAAPEVDPATGPLLELEAVTLRAPEGFRAQSSQFDFSRSAVAPPGGPSGSVYAAEGPAFSRIPLDRLARIDLRTGGLGEDRRIVDPVGVAGVRMYQIVGRSELEDFWAYGAIVGDQKVTIEIALAGSLSPAEQDSILGSVLASVSWS